MYTVVFRQRTPLDTVQCKPNIYTHWETKTSPNCDTAPLALTEECGREPRMSPYGIPPQVLPPTRSPRLSCSLGLSMGF